MKDRKRKVSEPPRPFLLSMGDNCRVQIMPPETEGLAERVKHSMEKVIKDGLTFTTVDSYPQSDKKESAMYVGKKVNYMGGIFQVSKILDDSVTMDKVSPHGGPPHKRIRIDKELAEQLKEYQEYKPRIEDLHIGQIVYNGIKSGKIVSIVSEAVDGNFIRVMKQDGSDNTERWRVDEITFHPNYDFSDLETVKSLHQELWKWIKNNPSKNKEDWPRWKQNGGDVPRVLSHCFYCEYDNEGCDECPGDWKSYNHEGKLTCSNAIAIYEYACMLQESPDAHVMEISKNIKINIAEIIKNS